MGHARSLVLCLFVGVLVQPACDPRDSTSVPTRSDPHSFSNSHEVVVEHVALDLTVDFEARRLRGRATLTIDNRARTTELWLDSWDLDVSGVRLDEDDTETTFEFGDEVEFLGRPLVVHITPETRLVHLEYETAPDAVALQWLEPEQTAEGRQPFLLSQSETVFARTWIPCQDSPAVRITFDATLRVPPGMLAVMSAVNPTEPSPDGVYRFEMPQAIPPYLLALAVGELAFRPIGPRSGVYAEPSVIDRAAWEFAETERMLSAVETLYGPYRWERYDLIVLPQGFPWGGMENPRLSFITPTLIAGDRSLVSTIAHEIAHSWSGNLVTSATWNDLWLNEGLTTYVERRVMETLQGRANVDMVALVDQDGLRTELEEAGPGSPDTHLRLDLAGRNPDDAFGDVAYEKGYLFFRMLEETLGREAWDGFLRGYFDEFAFGVVTTDGFVAYLRERMIRERPDAAELEATLQAWIDGPGLPQDRPDLDDSALRVVEQQARSWADGQPSGQLETQGWITQQWVHFIRALPTDAGLDRLTELDEAFGFTETGNAAVLQAWLLRTAGIEYGPADIAMERFLKQVGRGLFIEPLYEELARSPAGLERARHIYAGARAGYHPVIRRTIDEILEKPPAD